MTPRLGREKMPRSLGDEIPVSPTERLNRYLEPRLRQRTDRGMLARPKKRIARDIIVSPAGNEEHSLPPVNKPTKFIGLKPTVKGHIDGQPEEYLLPVDPREDRLKYYRPIPPLKNTSGGRPGTRGGPPARGR